MGIFDKILGIASGIFPPAKIAKDIISFIKSKSGNTGSVTDSQLSDLEPAIQNLIINRDADRDKYAAETMQVELESRATMIEAEMAQGDKFTKRARPTLVYAGLVMFFLEFIVRAGLVIRGLDMPEGTIVPGPFIIGWSGAVSVWMVGRSAEKISQIKNGNSGGGSKILKAIMG